LGYETTLNQMQKSHTIKTEVEIIIDDEYKTLLLHSHLTILFEVHRLYSVKCDVKMIMNSM